MQVFIQTKIDFGATNWTTDEVYKRFGNGFVKTPIKYGRRVVIGRFKVDSFSDLAKITSRVKDLTSDSQYKVNTLFSLEVENPPVGLYFDMNGKYFDSSAGGFINLVTEYFNLVDSFTSFRYAALSDRIDRLETSLRDLSSEKSSLMHGFMDELDSLRAKYKAQINAEFSKSKQLTIARNTTYGPFGGPRDGKY